MGAVLYFNLPENHFRSIDRHYLPSFVIFGTWIVYGAGFLLSRTARLPHKIKYPGTGLVLVLLLLAASSQISDNYRQADGSRRYFAYDYARNLLTSLPENTIFFVAGDANTYPVWYLQYVEGFRTDVTVCNLNLMNTTWYLHQILSRDPGFPLTLTDQEIRALRVTSWRDTTITLPAPANAHQGAAGPITVHVPPTLGDSRLFIHDQLLLKIFRENAWHRPIYFTLPEFAATWVTPYLRQEGVVYRLTAIESSPIDPAILSTNLLRRYHYRGFADPAVFIDEPTSLPIHRYYDAPGRSRTAGRSSHILSSGNAAYDGAASTGSPGAPGICQKRSPGLEIR